jgi:hypothetical protein
VSLMTAWFVSKQSRLWPKPLEIPSEMLARFDRHLSLSALSVWVGAAVFLAVSLFAVIQGATLSGGLGKLWLTSKPLFLQLLVAGVTLAILPRWAARRARLGRKRIRAWREELGEAM